MEQDDMSETEAETGRQQGHLLGKLYVLADQLEIRTLRNAAIDGIIRLFEKTSMIPTLLTLDVAYLEIPESSTLRRLIRDYFMNRLHSRWLSVIRDQVPFDFIFDLALTAERGFRKPPEPKFWLRCAYHEHDEGEPMCY